MTKKKSIVWKVAYCDPLGDLVSAGVVQKHLRHHYKKDMKTTPLTEGSKLFAFSELCYATAWVLAMNTELEIWEAEGENPEEVRWMCEFEYLEEQFQNFWSRYIHKKIDDFLYKDVAPKGTVFCDSITLLRRIT